jgi:hypothetical protein
VKKNMKSMGGNSLRQKWLDLIEKSKNGLLTQASQEAEDVEEEKKERWMFPNYEQSPHQQHYRNFQ